MSETMYDYEKVEQWINYGDMNPKAHGGTWVKWVGDMWQIVETQPPSAFLEEIAEGRHLVETYWVEPMDLWTRGDPRNGPTDRFARLVDEMGGCSGYENAMVDYPIDYWVAALQQPHRPDGHWVDSNDFWEHLETTYGIEQ